MFHLPKILYQICFENKYEGSNGSECLMSVDGTEFKITEPSPFNPVWFSHKFQGPGLRYELGIAIQTGWICWLAGPFPPGEFNDQEIFKLGLMNYLSPGEKVGVDNLIEITIYWQILHTLQ